MMSSKISVREMIAFYAKKGIAEYVCGSISFGADVRGYNQEVADLALLELARQIKISPNGRASEHLDHFLDGTGDAIYFDTGTLLNEVRGVRDRISSVVSQAISSDSIPVRRMSGTQKGMKIDIGQDVYDSTEIGQDWKNALGSYVFDWDFASSSNDKTRSIIEISGSNLYQWHPTVERWTQCIHEAGARLTESSIKAKNFWMIAKPCLVSIHTWKPVSS
jgi:hypothetical protein